MNITILTFGSRGDVQRRGSKRFEINPIPGCFPIQPGMMYSIETL